MYLITIEKSTGNYFTIRTDDETILARVLNSEGAIDVSGIKYYCSATERWVMSGRIVVPITFVVSISVEENGE